MTGNGVLQRFGARAAAALVALGTSVGAVTAEEAPPKRADSPLDRPQFEWVSASRDPFEYRPRKPKVVTGTGTGSGRRTFTEIITGTGTKKGNGDGQEGNGKNGDDTAQTLLKFILSRTRSAELRLSLREYAEAAKLATEALNRIAGHDPEGTFTEKLKRLRDTAQRLDERARIEKRFSELPISVEGIVWAPGKAVALINGKVKRPGQKVEGVTIGEIRRGEVIFVLEKGVRVRKQPLAAGAD